MVVTAPATWVSFPDAIGGCVVALHCLMFGVSVYDTNWKGFVLLSLRCSSWSSSSWIALMLLWWGSLSSCFPVNRLISAITISILRSLWWSVFQTYQDACSRGLCFEISVLWLCCSVLCIPIVVCHRSTQASISDYKAPACCVRTGPSVYPWASTCVCILGQALFFSWRP